MTKQNIFKIKIHTVSGKEYTIHFNAGDGMQWRKVLDSLKAGVLEVMMCEQRKEFVKINHNNIEFIELEKKQEKK